MTNENNTINSSSSKGLGRRSFLKLAGAAAAVLAMPPIINYANAKDSASCQDNIAKKRTLGTGKAAMEVSALGFGCMGATYNRGPHPDKKAMIDLIRQAAESGVTLFDTAEVYGPFNNEELAGEALEPFKGKVALTTKFGHDIVNGKGTGKVNSRPEHIKKVAEESLKRLKLDTLELFYQHRYDPNVPIEDVAGAIQDLIKEGKVKRYGLCEVTPDIIRKAHAVQPLTAIQSEYHLMWRDPEKAVIPTCKELGIGFVPYSPVNRGLLTGAINEYTNFNTPNFSDNRNILPRFTPEAIRHNLKIVELLTEFGRTRGMTPAQVSLAWLMAKEPWIVPIPGTTKLAHLKENLLTAELSLSPAEIEEIEKSVSTVQIMGDRYPASEQAKIAK